MNENVKANIAKNIKKLRLKKGVSQESMSLDLGFDVSYMGKVENQKMNVSLDRLIAIANFLEIDLSKLFKIL